MRIRLLLLALMPLAVAPPQALVAQGEAPSPEESLDPEQAAKDTEGNVIPPGQHAQGMPAGPDAKGEVEPVRNADGSISSPGAQNKPILSQPAPTPKPPTPTPTPSPTPTPTTAPTRALATAASDTSGASVPTLTPIRFKAPTIINGASALGQGNPPPTPTPQQEAGVGDLPLGHLWAILLGSLGGALLLMYLGLWRILLPRLKELERRLDLTLRPLDDGRYRGVRRFSRAQAEGILGMKRSSSEAPRSGLPFSGVSMAVSKASSSRDVVSRLISIALEESEGDVMVVSRRSGDDVLRHWQGHQGGGPEALRDVTRLMVAPGIGQSLLSLGRILERFLGETHGVLILEHPRWLAELDALTRAGWVLARLDRRLASLSQVSGVPIWIVFEEGPMAPEVTEVSTLPEGISALVSIDVDNDAGLRLDGRILGADAAEPKEGE